MQGTLVETLKWARPTVFFAVPRIWEKFEEKMQSAKAPISVLKKALGLDACHSFFYGAAPLKHSSVDYFASQGMIIYNAYGMSETSGGHAHHNTDKYKLYVTGCCLPGGDMKIDRPDEHGEGEILMKGRDIMMGYLKNEKATTETIDSEGYLHSGDRGKIDADGFLSITGRIKELIITAGGENVAPVIIEDNFKLLCPPCSNMMVIGDGQRFLGALISFKVDVNPKTGGPSRNLIPEV
jgi:long-chain-fatty-acid--CoA ligase ACSBG